MAGSMLVREGGCGLVSDWRRRFRFRWTISNPVRDDQFLPRQGPLRQFIELGVRFLAVHRDNRADTAHKIAAIGEGVLVIGMIGL